MALGASLAVGCTSSTPLYGAPYVPDDAGVDAQSDAASADDGSVAALYGAVPADAGADAADDDGGPDDAGGAGPKYGAPPVDGGM
jgi:hypothetical protein